MDKQFCRVKFMKILETRHGKWKLNRKMILPYQTRTIIVLSINHHINE